MTEQAEFSKQTDRKASAGLVGAGSGTLIVLLGASLPEADPLRSWIAYAVPTLTIAVVYGWMSVFVKVTNYFAERNRRRLVARLRAELEEGLNNPNTSLDHKAHLLRELEQLEQNQIVWMISKIEAVETWTLAGVTAGIDGFQPFSRVRMKRG